MTGANDSGKPAWRFAAWAYHSDRSVKRFKARWVGCGYSQVTGVDYHDVFASTLPISAGRCFFAMCNGEDLEYEEIDGVKAFTQGEFGDGEELYIEQPHFCEVDDPDVVGCLLTKPLEGTNQAAHLWQKAVAEQHRAMGYS